MIMEVFIFKPGNMHSLVILLALLQISLIAEQHDTTLLKIKQNWQFIEHSAKVFDLNPKYLAAVIYVERNNNYDWTDEIFDIYRAKIGQNSSIGFCQIKIRTAYFIEKQFNDSNSKYNVCDKYQSLIKVSPNTNILLDKLIEDSVNIFYAGAYLYIIQNHWKNAGCSIKERPDILGTLYQTGLFNFDSSERKPRRNPKSNEFGLKVARSVKYFRKF